MDPSQAHQVAGRAAHGFLVLQCSECAENIKKELNRAGYRGQQIEIRGSTGKPFIVCLSYDGGATAISQNGRHLGIKVGDFVFDNLHPHGMLYDKWLRDFDARGGVLVHRVEGF